LDRPTYSFIIVKRSKLNEHVARVFGSQKALNRVDESKSRSTATLKTEAVNVIAFFFFEEEEEEEEATSFYFYSLQT
jgi:hypothetical protein